MENINNVNNQKYSSYKIWNLCLILVTYMLASFGLKLIWNISGEYYKYWVSGSAFIGVFVSFGSLMLVLKQNKYFKKVIYPLIFFKGEKVNKYKKSLMRYRTSVYIGEFIQVILILLFDYWFLLVYIYPDSVILYDLPKVSFVTIVTYLAIFFAVDSQLDNIYWKYFETDFLKYEREQFKKKGLWSDKILKNRLLIFLVLLFLVFVFLPLFVQMHFGLPYQLATSLTQGNHSDWLQFWGSYLGVIPAGLIAYAVARYQIESDKRERSTEESIKNLPYLTIDLDQPVRYYKQDNVYNYIVDYFIKFSAYNTFYPIRAVTIFLYFNTADDDEYVLKDTILLGDISPCVDDFTHVRFDFDNENKNLDGARLIIYGRLIDGRVVKIQADKDKSSHLYMTDEKVWYSYEPEPLEDSFDELEKAEIRERR